MSDSAGSAGLLGATRNGAAALLVGLVLTVVVAFLIGKLTLRLSGHYLPLATIAWGLSLYFLFGTMGFLGGHTGLTGIPPISLFGYELRQGEEVYYLVWLFVLAGVLTTSNLLDSREGRAIRALKGGMVMAEAMGVDTARSRMVIFILAALLACASGWLYAHMQRFVNPTPFGLHIGIEYLFMAVVGGAAHVWGALVGAGVASHSQFPTTSKARSSANGAQARDGVLEGSPLEVVAPLVEDLAAPAEVGLRAHEPGARVDRAVRSGLSLCGQLLWRLGK